MNQIKSQLNSSLKPLVAPFAGAINMLPISSSQKTQLKNYPATFFMNTWIRGVIGDPLAVKLLNSMVQVTGKKSLTVGGKTFRTGPRKGDPAMLTRMQLLLMISKYPNTAISLLKKRAGLAGTAGVGNYCGGSFGLGCLDPITMGPCLAIISIIGSLALVAIVGPMIWEFINSMMAPTSTTTTAPSDAGPAFGPAAMLPGGAGPAFGPSFDTPVEPGMQPYADTGEGPPIALIVGGTALAGVAAWFVLGRKKKKRR
jgi:LPXTG-motif cell wall-anchored protein